VPSDRGRELLLERRVAPSILSADFSRLAAAVNLARFGVLGLRQGPNQTWATTTI